MRIKGWRSRLRGWFLPRLIRIVILALSATIRWQFVGGHDPSDRQRFIYSFWHARLLMEVIGLKDTHSYVLISEHRDGALIAETMHLFGIHTVRGSSTRGGVRALLSMIRKAREEDCNFGITPDGPRGPREVVQPGTVQLAKKTGLPVRPVLWATKRQWRITSSWDHFYIPKPFTRGVYLYGEPLWIGPDDDDAEALARVQQAMDRTQQQVDGWFDERKRAAENALSP